MRKLVLIILLIILTWAPNTDARIIMVIGGGSSESPILFQNDLTGCSACIGECGCTTGDCFDAINNTPTCNTGLVNASNNYSNVQVNLLAEYTELWVKATMSVAARVALRTITSFGNGAATYHLSFRVGADGTINLTDGIGYNGDGSSKMGEGTQHIIKIHFSLVDGADNDILEAWIGEDQEIDISNANIDDNVQWVKFGNLGGTEDATYDDIIISTTDPDL